VTADIDQTGNGNSTLADPKMKSRFADLGGTPLPGSPADYATIFANGSGQSDRTRVCPLTTEQRHWRTAAMVLVPVSAPIEVVV
jgi:hypothetical protein